MAISTLVFSTFFFYFKIFKGSLNSSTLVVWVGPQNRLEHGAVKKVMLIKQKNLGFIKLK
jgi:hypothetical protein